MSTRQAPDQEDGRLVMDTVGNWLTATAFDEMTWHLVHAQTETHVIIKLNFQSITHVVD